MSIHNQYANISLTEAEIHALSAQFDAIRAITDTLPEIDPLIMRHVPKMGNKTQTFSRDTFRLAAQRQHLLPRGLDLEAIEELFKKRDALKSCLVQAKHLAKHLELLLRLVGSDLFSAALAAYKAMKTNDRNAASDPALQELSRTFSRTKKREEKEEVEEQEESGLEELEVFARNMAAETGAPERGQESDAEPAKEAKVNERKASSSRVIPSEAQWSEAPAERNAAESRNPADLPAVQQVGGRRLLNETPPIFFQEEPTCEAAGSLHSLALGRDDS